MKALCFKYITALIFTGLLTACGGSGSSGGGESSGGTDGNQNTLTGVFVDSPVNGLRWVSGGDSGTTDASGAFQYTSGDSVQFYVGDILIGEAAGNSVIIPLDLVENAEDITDPTVTNIVRFLLTLDDDNDPSNGILITETVASLAEGETIDFSQSTADFAASGDVQVLVAALTSATTAGARDITSVADALAHAESSIQGLLAGTYSGTFSGDLSGTWAGTISSLGIFSGTATTSDGTVSFLGFVEGDGSGSADFETSGGVSDGTTFTGAISPVGVGSGIWFLNSTNGTWSGSKTN